MRSPLPVRILLQVIRSDKGGSGKVEGISAPVRVKTTANPAPAPFVCPSDEGSLAPVEGGWDCPACGRNYPLVRGILDFVEPKLLDEHQRFERERRGRLVDFDGGRLRYEREVEREAVLRRLDLERGRGFGQHILDAGCGAGHLTRGLVALGASVTAVDFAPERLAYLQAQLPAALTSGSEPRLRLAVADIAHLPLRRGTFDAIVCTQVLEHFPSAAVRRAALASFHDRLRAGGQLLLTVYNYSEAWRRRGMAVEGRHETGIFYHCYQPVELAADLRAAGFAVSELCGVVHLLPHAYRALPRLGRLGRELDHWVESRTGASRRWGQLLLAAARRG